MCGITGIWHLDGSRVEEQKITRFNNSLTHRGPDGFGTSFHNNETLALGHRRLSILDLSEAGKQPMTYADGQLTITFNGEIFNYLEIRDELKKHGYAFRSETDTEVVLAAYHHWGKECLHRFNGMWSFAIWDERRQELFLARDRFGIKPLYYHYSPSKIFTFASETLAFRYLKGFRRYYHQENLSLVKQRPYLLEGRGETIFEGIYQILPGCSAIIRKESFTTSRWYNMTDHLSQTRLSYREQIEQFDELFTSSCKLRLRSDVPVTTTLSGGLDSSAIFSTLQSIKKDQEFEGLKIKDWNTAVTAVFPNTDVNELKYAERVVESFQGSKWIKAENEVANLRNEIINVTEAFDTISPTAMNSISIVYKNVKSNGFTVSMDGHGVDEMLYGYRSYLHEIFLAAQSDQRVGLPTSEIIDILANLHLPSTVESARRKYNLDYKTSRSLKARFGRILKPSKKAAGFEFQSQFTSLLYNFQDFELDKRILYNDFYLDSLPTFLRDFDRASMMHGVEVRTPFLDFRLVEFLNSLPTSSKMGSGMTKRILRDFLIGKLPEEIVKRTYKVGIGAPLKHWIENELSDLACDILLSDNKSDSDVTRVNAASMIKKLKSKNLNSKEVQEIWFKMNLNFIKL